MTGIAPGEIRTTCAYCGVGCGVLAKPDGQCGITVRGDPDHPANYGRLCSKGVALGETLSLDDRLVAPRVNGAEAAWDDALDLVANRFTRAIAEHGPDAVAFYVSGQLLTEDYYVANKLMKGFIGSANIDTNSRLCMASTVAGHKRAFGTDTVPGTYEDIELADLVVLVGSNLAWCHPVLYQRLAQAKANRPEMRIVVIDPRRTATCDLADLHLALEPGSDVALFNRLLTAIHEGGAVDIDYLHHVDGFDAALAKAGCEDGRVTGLRETDIRAFCDLWVRTEKVVTVFSQGVNQSTSGTDKVNAILNCHLATGRIGRPGMGPLSVTGQPNAMGGREVGGLANALACHMELTDPAHRNAVQAFWNAPAMPQQAGLKAVDLFDRVADGTIKALWIICTNPAVSMPEADRVRDAIAGCEFVVVSDVTDRTDTAQLAHVLLPATGWAEKDGTVTNSDRTISRQRALLPAPGQARHDWDILADVGRRMGWGAAFDYAHPSEIFEEHAALSAVAADFALDFDISGLRGLDRSGYDALAPIRWPITASGTVERFFADGHFYTADGRARMLPVTARPPAARTNPRYPFRLNTGRIRDQWHTMTRTAKAPRLNQHLGEPFLEVHPDDAAALGIAPATLVAVTSPSGRCVLRASITDRVVRGQVFAPMHWTAQTAPTGRVDALVASAVDPLSGQPESKAAVVALASFEAGWFGFAVSANALNADSAYWARSKVTGGWRAEMAGTQIPDDWEAEARRLFDLPETACQSISDASSGTARLAFSEGGLLVAALFVSRVPVALSRDHLAAQLGQPLDVPLAGRPGAARPDPGPMLCACMGVGRNTILAAIASGEAATVAEVGACTTAGTNCGSCRPEIADILDNYKVLAAAE
ncbi:nitrate reductase [Jannaschia donghaensis]|uniref:Nitrate reductase n=1 Tax=Jannaschia donghaensis TaxID=420998 RepID=A0A0M6YNH4_9RHOB|nr:nitrate reductase [Jannaschia donghaensis]CTQ51480.1 Nitrate reductase [Jannaschia donghaensis]